MGGLIGALIGGALWAGLLGGALCGWLIGALCGALIAGEASGLELFDVRVIASVPAPAPANSSVTTELANDIPKNPVRMNPQSFDGVALQDGRLLRAPRYARHHFSDAKPSISKRNRLPNLLDFRKMPAHEPSLLVRGRFGENRASNLVRRLVARQSLAGSRRKLVGPAFLASFPKPTAR